MPPPTLHSHTISSSCSACFDPFAVYCNSLLPDRQYEYVVLPMCQQPSPHYTLKEQILEFFSHLHEQVFAPVKALRI